jgi:hypothetical protein
MIYEWVGQAETCDEGEYRSQGMLESAYAHNRNRYSLRVRPPNIGVLVFSHP